MLSGSILLAGTWVVVAISHGVPAPERDVFEWVNDLPDALWRRGVGADAAREPARIARWLSP